MEQQKHPEEWIDELADDLDEQEERGGAGRHIVLRAQAEEAGMRLDSFVASRCAELTRSFVQNLIRQGEVFSGGKAQKANFRLKEGTEVEFFLVPPKEIGLEAEDIPLDIVYEDSDLAVVNKPQGMVVHPAPGNERGTLVNALMFHVRDLAGIGGELRPGIVHRIDKDTSGLLVVAKNDEAHRSLAAQIKAKTARRVYWAILEGCPKEESGTVNAPIGRSPKDRKKMAVVPDGRSAVTHYKVLRRFDGFSLVECRLETGRTHQIRVHMARIGHPVAGDPLYGPQKSRLGLSAQALHAIELTLTHPSSGQTMRFYAPPPENFLRCLRRLGGAEGATLPEGEKTFFEVVQNPPECGILSKQE